MVEVESGDVLEMRDEAFAEVLDEINQKTCRSRLAVVLPVSTLLTAFAAGYFLQFGVVTLMLSALPLWLIGRWIDAYRRATVLVYELGDGTEGSFRRLTEAFDRMMGMRRQMARRSGRCRHRPCDLEAETPAPVISCSETRRIWATVCRMGSRATSRLRP